MQPLPHTCQLFRNGHHLPASKVMHGDCRTSRLASSYSMRVDAHGYRDSTVAKCILVLHGRQGAKHKRGVPMIQILRLCGAVATAIRQGMHIKTCSSTTPAGDHDQHWHIHAFTSGASCSEGRFSILAIPGISANALLNTQPTSA